MDKLKNNLIEALTKKGIAVAKRAVVDNAVKERLSEINDIYTEVIKFVDANDSKAIQFALWHAYAHGHYGRMYKYVMKLLDEKRSREHFEELAAINGAQGYEHIRTVINRMMVTAYPSSFRLF